MNDLPAGIGNLIQEAVRCFQAGDLASAKAACDQVIAYDAAQPDALNLLAVISRAAKKWGKAEQIARFGRSQNPQDTKLANTLGLILLDQRRAEEALEAFNEAHAGKPHKPEYLSNLGLALKVLGRWEEAQTAYSKALQLDPNFVSALLGRSSISTELGNYTAAEVDIDFARRLSPNNPEVATSIAKLRLCQGDLEAAYTAFDQAVANTANVADAKVNRGLIRMLQGRIEDGWADYGMRRWRRWGRVSSRYSEIPAWQGEDLTGKTILLWCEQGLGEAILCASLMVKLASEASAVLLECDPRMVSLFQRSFPNITVVPGQSSPHSDIISASPDVQAPIFELVVYRAQNSIQQEPSPAYLIPDSSRVAEVRARYSEISKGQPLIGLSWGSPKAASARQKSIPVGYWASVLKTPGVAFVNLQYGDARDALNDLAVHCQATFIEDPFIDPSGSLDAVADQIAALDLVLTVSNTTGHLAGALGKETWIMVPPLGLGSMWYWFVDRLDSPWYALVSLLRRQVDSDDAFMNGLSARLKDWLSQRL
jgi:Tfp pilus assembly protein PilF